MEALVFGLAPYKELNMIENESGDIVALDNSGEVIVEETKTEPVESVEEIEVQQNEEEQANGEEVKKKKLGGWQRKAVRLEKELAEERARNANVAKPVETKEPQLNDYETYDAYNRAVSRWEAKQEIQAHEQKLNAASEATKQREAAKSWEAKIDSLKDPDEFYEKLEEYKDYKIKDVIVDAIKESEIGPEVFLHLTKNPDLFDELNQKTSSIAIIRELSKIETQLMNSQKPVVKGSKSPAPINPVKGSSPTSVSDEDLDTDAFIRKHYPNLTKRR